MQLMTLDYITLVPAMSTVCPFFFFNDTATTEIYTNRSSAASDVYKRQADTRYPGGTPFMPVCGDDAEARGRVVALATLIGLSLIHISEPTRPY